MTSMKRKKGKTNQYRNRYELFYYKETILDLVTLSRSFYKQETKEKTMQDQ